MSEPITITSLPADPEPTETVEVHKPFYLKRGFQLLAATTVALAVGALVAAKVRKDDDESEPENDGWTVLTFPEPVAEESTN